MRTFTLALAFAALAAAPWVLAQDEAPKPETPAAGGPAEGTASAPAEEAPADQPFGKRILFGAIAGIIASLVGWAKNRNAETNTQEKLDFRFVAVTVGVGAVVGAVAGGLGKTIPEFFNSYESLPVWGMAMMGVEALLKAVFRQSIGIGKAFGLIRKGAENPTPPASPNPPAGS